MAIHIGYDSGEPKRVPAGNETDGTDELEDMMDVISELGFESDVVF